MPTTSELLSQADAHLLKTYRQPPLVLTRGEGCRVWDTEGRRYLDLYAGIAVSALGHAHPRLVQAITAQAGRLVHASNYFYNDRQIELTAALTARTGYDRVFFCNSGTEANEGALKLVRRYFYARGDTERMDVVAAQHSFHGRTLGALALTGQPKYREGFGPPLAGVSHVAYGDIEAMRRRVNDHTAAVFIEPIQGEGGVIPAPLGYLQGLRALCDNVGALLVADEIQTGVGRTGRFLAMEHDGVRADVTTLAKGLGGGVPIGAILVRERLAQALPPGTHGTTFGGNPLAAAAALAVLETLDTDGLIAHAQHMGNHLLGLLQGVCDRLPGIAVAARGRGLLCGLVLASGVDPRAVLDTVRERGVLITLAGDRVIRFAPPLVVTAAELDEGVAVLESVLGDLRVVGPDAMTERRGETLTSEAVTSETVTSETVPARRVEALR